MFKFNDDFAQKITELLSSGRWYETDELFNIITEQNDPYTRGYLTAFWKYDNETSTKDMCEILLHMAKNKVSTTMNNNS